MHEANDCDISDHEVIKTVMDMGTWGCDLQKKTLLISLVLPLLMVLKIN